MSVKSILKRNRIILKGYIAINNAYYCLLTIISPKLNTEARFKSIFGRKPDLNNPQTFNEKLIWLKIYKYMNNSLVNKCADKLRVREYVDECGVGYILNNLFGVYKHARNIPWDKLPNRFVLKWNFGAGFNIVCKDKSHINIKKVVKQLNKWERVKYWLPYSEMQYKGTKKRIICEEYLEDTENPGVIPDYKVYCFHGHPKAIFVMHDRGNDIKSEFFDIDWNLLENTQKYLTPEHVTPKPNCLREMLDIAEKLSEPFPFVRCDFYVVNNKLYFGELTFTPAGCLFTSTTKIDGNDMGTLLHVPC